jgi:small subunit ribosomal protein S11
MAKTSTKMASKVATKRKKAKKVITNGCVYIHATFNNTLVYVTDLEGNVLSWATAGGQGFKGSRKSTPWAGSCAAQEAAKKAQSDYGMKNVDIYIKGPGSGREMAARAVAALFNVFKIEDITGVPHNGCRPENERRI